MSQNKEDLKREFSTSSELREFVDDNLERNNTDVHSHTGLVSDEQSLRIMSILEEMYQPNKHPDLPYSFKDTKLGQMLRKRNATQVATQAVKDGNISQMKYVTGRQSYNNDVSGIHTLRKLRNQIDSDAYIQYMFGHMGNGKTEFAILQAELAVKELGYETASNIKSWSEKDKYIFSFGDLLTWLADGQEVNNLKDFQDLDIEESNKLVIFDEASNHASGYSDDAYETQKKLGKLVKLIRKVGGNLIIIGHTGKDVHPDIRRITNDCVKKVSKKTAEYYNSVEEAEGKGHKFTISHIPRTNFSYDTREVTMWDWTMATSDEIEEGRQNAKEAKESKEKRDLRIAKAKVENPDWTYERITRELDLDISPQRVGQILTKMQKEVNQ